MKVRVLLFASLREAASTPEFQLEVEPGARAGSVLSELGQRLPRSAALLERSVLAINDEYAAAGAMLHEGDTVAVIPPVSGGAALTSPTRLVDDVPHNT